MSQLLAALFAAGFNVQQMLATGVIGGGAALMIGVVAQLVQKPKPPAEGQLAPKKLSPMAAVLMMGVGLAIVVIGVIWRVASQQPRDA